MVAVSKLLASSERDSQVLLRSRAGTRQDFLREMVHAIRWLGQDQSPDAIGFQHGIRTASVYPLSRQTSDLYYLRAVPHTSTGKPALQIVLLDSFIGDRRVPREVPEPDQELFRIFCDRLSHGKIVADWMGVNGGSFYSVAMNLRVHPALMKAVTFNTSSIAPPLSGRERLERMTKFRVPEGWT